MHYIISLGVAKKLLLFIKKKIFNVGTEMRRGYPNTSGMGMEFNFSFPLGMGRVTDKYMRNEYRDEKYKTRPHPASLPCLIMNNKIGSEKVIRKSCPF